MARQRMIKPEFCSVERINSFGWIGRIPMYFDRDRATFGGAQAR
jgi:hypothetical protein